MGRPLPLTLSATGRKLQLHRHLNQSESLPIKHSFCSRSAMLSARLRRIRAIWHRTTGCRRYFRLRSIGSTPFPNGDAPLERSWGQNIRINHTISFSGSRAAASLLSFGVPIPVRKVPKRQPQRYRPTDGGGAAWGHPTEHLCARLANIGAMS